MYGRGRGRDTYTAMTLYSTFSSVTSNMTSSSNYKNTHFSNQIVGTFGFICPVFDL